MPTTPVQPSDAEDIFAPTESVGNRTASASPARRNVVPYQGETQPPEPRGGLPPKVLFLIIIACVIIIVIGGLVGLAWWRSQPKPESTNGNQNNNQAVNNNNLSNVVEENINKTPVVIPNVNTTVIGPADSDRDGLTDEEEATLGTNPQVADTDGDGLSDFAEVHIYHSNPLLADSDKNGTSDGDEVSAGENPAGSGRLFDITNQNLNSL